MQFKYENDMYVHPSLCDDLGEMGYYQTFLTLMNYATIHAESVGIGESTLMQEDLYWIAVKTKVKFFEKPKMMERIHVETWPEVPDRLKYDRDYRLSRNGKILCLAKTRWSLLNVKTNRIYTGKPVYPEGCEYVNETSFDDPFDSFSTSDFAPDIEYDYLINSMDIDLGKHMNNAAYVKAFFTNFTNEEIHKMNISEIDISYKNQAYEGEKMTFKVKNNPDSIQVIGAVQEKTIFTMTVKCVRK